MIKQSDIFLQGEGRNWLKRNAGKIDAENDPVLKMIKDADLQPKRVLEIGCADGWRLLELQRRYNCTVEGIDPSGEYGHPLVLQGSAADLCHFFDEDYDLVIYGFCLYLCDREDLFRIAMEGDRVLADKGHMIIWDFCPFTHHKRPYAHKQGMFSHKMHYADLWLGNPAYRTVRLSYQQDDNDIENTRTSVAVLKKDVEAAWPLKSF